MTLAPCRRSLLLVDNRPTDFARYLAARSDIDLAFLRFDGFANAVPYWPQFAGLPEAYRAQMARVPSFDVDPGTELRLEADRYTEWATSLPRPPLFFCNPEEHLQDIGNRFARFARLPYLREEQVAWVRNKAIMKDRFVELKVPCASYRRVGTAADVESAGQELGWPLVLKPVDSFATIDTYRLTSFEQLKPLLARLPTRSWMVEEFIDGQEFQLCGLVFGGRVLDLFVSVNPVPVLEAVDGAMNADVTLGPGATDPELRQRVAEYVDRLVEGMGIANAYIHMEFFLLRDGTIRMSEIAARLAGAGIPRNHGLAYGFDIYDSVLDVYTGRRPPLIYTKDRCVGDLLLPVRPGRVRSVTSLERLLELPGVIDGALDLRPGDVVQARRASNTRAGIIHVEGFSVNQVLRRMQSVLKTFSLDVESDGVEGADN